MCVRDASDIDKDRVSEQRPDGSQEVFSVGLSSQSAGGVTARRSEVRSPSHFHLVQERKGLF